MVAFISQASSESERNQSDSNKPKEGLVYSTEEGIYLFRGECTDPKEDDVLIAPIGSPYYLCYHVGYGAPDGALFDLGGSDHSRIRRNKIIIMGGYIDLGHRVILPDSGY